MKARWLLLALILLAATYLDLTEPVGAAQTAPLECESMDGYGYPVDVSGYVK